MGKQKQVELGDHILGVFHEENEIDYGSIFLKEGFEHNEAVMLITDRFSKNYLRDLLSKKFKIDDIKMRELNGEIIFKTTQEWYFPSGKVEPKRIIKQWNDWVELSIQHDKEALRVFADTSSFFKHGLGHKLMKYESELANKFDIPLTAVCAYTFEDLKGIGKSIYSELKTHHNAVWMGK